MADNSSGAMSAIVAIVAVIVVLIVGYFAIQMLAGQDAEPAINVELPDVNPAE